MATRKRTDFSESQKADIFARDRATCAFSGISVWLFDYGVRHNYEIDWADHIKPSARGGTSSLDNGICASSLFNAKKKDNGSDNIFFFKNGRVTKAYITTFGYASDQMLADLNRRSRLEPGDWYLNRSISNVYFAFDWRCNLEFKKVDYKRDDNYWLKAAWKRHMKWQKIQPSESIQHRKLLDPNHPFGASQLLELESIRSEDHFRNWAESIWPTYRQSWKTDFDFNLAIDPEHMRSILNQASIEVDVHPDVIRGLSQLIPEDEPSIQKVA